jgi:hypothetical protein
MPTMFKRTLLSRDTFLFDDGVRHFAALTTASGVKRSIDLTQVKPPPTTRGNFINVAARGRRRMQPKRLATGGSSMQQRLDPSLQPAGALGGAAIRGA